LQSLSNLKKHSLVCPTNTENI